jgi:hypothetical protein
MRQTIFWTGLLATVLCTSCGPQSVATDAAAGLRKDSVLWRSHFVGGTRLEGNTNATRWVKLAAAPIAQQLRDQTLRKLATAPFRALQDKMPAGAKDQAESWQPLLADLLRAESFVEWRGTSNRIDQFALAIKLPDDRAKAWSANLGTILKAWTGIAPVPFTQGNVSGWQLRKHDPPNLFGVARVGTWVVVGAGQDALSLFNAFIGSLKTGAAPFAVDAGVWGEAWADWPQLEAHLPFSLPVHPPQAHLTITGKDNFIRLNGGLEFDRSLNWRPQPWRIPETLIREPLISFTAVRGVAPVLQQDEFLRQWKFKSVPDEAYVWAMDGVPFATFVAAPTTDAAAQIQSFGPDLQARYNPLLAQRRLGSLEMSTNRDALSWRGLPIVIPHLSATKDGANDFLFGGLFPNAPKAKPPPGELFDQVRGRKTLAYYDWEVTEPRLKQWKVLSQLNQIMDRQPPLRTNMLAVQWLNSVTTNLGNTVTEITVSGDRQMTLTRKAPIGLTAYELVALTTWLEATNFPFSTRVSPASPTGLRAVKTQAKP